MAFKRGRQGNPAAYKRKRITVRSVEALQLGERLWDEELPGFVVRYRGRSKIYGLQYRLAGRKRWLTIGRHGVFTPTQARLEAKRLLGEVARGVDPAANRDRLKSVPTVADLGECFLVEHVRLKLKPSTQAEYTRIIRKRVGPALGDLRINAITESDINRLHRSLSPMPYEANRVVAVLSKMMAFAERRGLRVPLSNPCRGIERYRERKRERFLTKEELARLGEAIREVEDSGRVTPFAIAAIRLLLFTGARRGEILSLRWEYVDFQRGILHLPDSKTGAKPIHLNAPALEVLSNLARLNGNPFVIAGGRADQSDKGRAEGQPLKDLITPWKLVCELAGLQGIRLHDLRHSFASVAASGGAPLLIIGKLLSHSNAMTTARYAHLAADPVRQFNEKTGNAIALALRNRHER